MKKIRSEEEYKQAKEHFALLFHANPCETDHDESHELLKQLEEYEKSNISDRKEDL